MHPFGDDHEGWQLGLTEEEPSRLFYTNFEIGRVRHFLRTDVREFTHAIRRSNGIFRYRWGDAIVRFLQVALFATSREVYCFTGAQLAYCHSGCCTGSGSYDAKCCEPCLQTPVEEKNLPVGCCSAPNGPCSGRR